MGRCCAGEATSLIQFVAAVACYISRDGRPQWEHYTPHRRQHQATHRCSCSLSGSSLKPGLVHSHSKSSYWVRIWEQRLSKQEGRKYARVNGPHQKRYELPQLGIQCGALLEGGALLPSQESCHHNTTDRLIRNWKSNDRPREGAVTRGSIDRCASL